MLNRLVKVAGVALVLTAGVAGCAHAQTVPRKAARVTLDGTTHVASPPACSQTQQYRTIDIRDRGGQVEAVVLISGDRAIPQWVKIRNVDGFNGSAWEGGVGQAHVDLVKSTYTFTGSAYGIDSRNPNKVVTTDFKIVADC
ncbi:hypothetical protein A9W99_21560 [Mycobacterium sp. 1164966.3]|uniref:lipoprotein LpqH n=1 Tax=Mycobacterium sp. 1164966.3 TaxID=1856861 RepID=UPI000800BDF5|nr:lipoprotein LpqH [Mycobacterium sp. 1164966.3]OBA79080.1 hypothetical protein A9W99_21560 [Mycobacterium sp. 1164966.3]